MKKIGSFLVSFSIVALVFSVQVLPVLADPPDTVFSGDYTVQSNNTQITTFAGLVGAFMGVLNSIVPLLIAAAIVYTMYTALMMVKEEGEKRDEWRTKLIYGIVAIFVMISVYGLVNILVGTFDLVNAPITRPTIQ